MTQCNTHPLDPLINPQSIALIGASARANTSGRTLFDMACVDGYPGRVYLVNPRYQSIDGQPCYPTIDALPETVDHAAIALHNNRLENTLDQVIAHGAKAATIFASCLSAENQHPGQQSGQQSGLASAIKQKAAHVGLLLCGGNSMGLYNRVAGLRFASFGSKTPLRAGGVAWVVQSGSAISAIAHGDRRLGFTLCVSTGMELTTTAAEYADWALSQTTTRVIGMFLESVRHTEKFIAMLQRANQQQIPVVILKVGRTEKSATMAQSHTGAIVGDDVAFNAVCDRYGVIRVRDFNEMIATLQLLDRDVSVLDGALATMHDSGGERELLVDLAQDIDVPLANIDTQTKTLLEQNLDVGLVPENPLDAWGTPNNAEQRMVNCLRALANDPATGLAFFCSNPQDDYWYAAMLQQVVATASQQTDTPLAMVCHSSLAQNAKMASRLADQGIPLITGTQEALKAAKHAIDYKKYRHKPKEVLTDLDKSLIDFIQTQFQQHTGTVSEREGLNLLGTFGLPTVSWVSVCDTEQALQAADTLGYPVALKTDEGNLHKTDVAGVYLNLSDAGAVKAAYQDMAERLGPEAIIGPMITSGVEVGLGAVIDPDFGPVVVISAGGTLIEVLDDKQTAAAPFGPATARTLLQKMRLWPQLLGTRGQAEADIEDLCNTIARFSQFADLFASSLLTIDINPIIAGPQGCCAVDALIILSSKT